MQLKNYLLRYQNEIDGFVVPSIEPSSSISLSHSQTSESALPPIRTIDLEPLQSIVQNINAAIVTQNYQEATIHDVTTAIDKTLHSQLLGLLDIRAFCYALQGQRESAIADTQRMIEYGPTMTMGYLRKGDVFSMYGQQKQAIEAYKQGLQNSVSDNSRIDQLNTAREAAEHLNSIRIDFITRLPTDVANGILRQLPQETVAVCLTISSTWRHRTLNCKSLWRELSICDGPIGVQLVNILPYIPAPLIQSLIIHSRSNQVQERCFEHIKSGSFKRIKSLKITAPATKSLRAQLIVVSVAFWEARHTLTSLDLDFSDNQNPITLAEVLLACCSVTKLTYTASSSMSTLAGDLSALKDHQVLANLQLKASSITGTSIEVMLQKCQQLQRLVMNGCDSTVLNPINLYAKNLKILGYNHPYHIEDMPEDPSHVPGLQKIYTQDGGAPIPASQILPLLYRNMTTLVEVFANISTIPENEIQQFSTVYADLKFQKLISLTSWCYEGIQDLMLRAIRDTNTLALLSLSNIHRLQTAVDVTVKLPPLTELRISHTNTETNGTSLTTLLDKYAKISANQHSLEVITFQYCAEITDTVLTTLASIRTLRDVTFRCLKSITSDGINEFLRKIGRQLESVTFGELPVVTDNHVTTLGEFKCLKQVDLDKLPMVTDQGIRNMFDTECHSLEKMTVTGCAMVTEECIQYARKKVKTVVYN